MGFSINVEYTGSLTEKTELEIDSVRDRAIRKLKEAALPVVREEKLRKDDSIPLVFMHINIMDAGRGLVPYSISIRFYQPVKLVLNRDIQTPASTWETGLVGIVSYDSMNEIRNAAVDLLQDFIDDYNQVNF